MYIYGMCRWNWPHAGAACFPFATACNDNCRLCKWLRCNWWAPGLARLKRPFCNGPPCNWQCVDSFAKHES